MTPSGAKAVSRLPKVTAIIPTRDRPEVLRRAVAAVLGQDYEGEIECLVVFDQEAPSLPDVPVPPSRELRATENVRTPGLAGARNSGAEVAGGTLLAFCDDDDEWLPAKLRLQVEALRRHPDASAATCGIYVMTGARKIPRVPTGETIDRADLVRSRRMEAHSSTLVMERRRFLGDIGPIDEEIPGSYGEDYDWLLRAAEKAPLAVVPRPLVKVYWQTSYFSDRWQMMIPALHYQLSKHPELTRDPRNLSRMYGRIAFAHAASGERTEARAWARRSIRLDWRQPRGYLTYLVTLGVSPRFVQRVVNATGKGL
jgi:glycosyltransferase involved in cell wall biosynthesis